MRRTCPILVLAILVLAACGSDSAPRVANSPSGAKASASGPLLVFAAASLTESFENEKTTLQSEQPGVDVTYNFAGSGTLVTQVQQGAPADVIATADTATMEKLSDAGLVETPVVFAHNKLEIVVAPGNPKGINSLADLSRSDVTVVLADRSVPAGKYAAQILQNADVTVAPKSLEPDVKATIARVSAGDADAAIVYVTDVKAAGSKVAGVEIPGGQNALVDYPIAIVKATSHHDAAAAFVDAIVKGSGQTALQANGFLPA